MSHESKLEPYQYHRRPVVVEEGLITQEKTLAMLLQQAFRITEQVAESLQSTKGSIQVESLLKSHIMTITRIVKQFSIDIQTLQKQITQQDSIISGTTLAVQSLDQKSMAGIGDLRGRVARCDAGIAKLSSDMSSGERQIMRLQKEVAELRLAVDLRVKELEIKLRHNLGNLQSSWTEQSKGQRISMSDLQRNIKLLEDTMSAGIKEVKRQTNSLTKWTEQQLITSFQRHARSSQHRSLLQDKMIEVESKLAERLCALEAHVEQFETQQDRTDQGQASQLKRSETRLSKRMTLVENSLQRELQLLKQEYHKGFLSVHDAIDSLRQIGDIKSHLDKKKLHKDMKHICSKALDICD